VVAAATMTTTIALGGPIGPIGPTGPTDVTGPTGPTGPTARPPARAPCR